MPVNILKCLGSTYTEGAVPRVCSHDNHSIMRLMGMFVKVKECMNLRVNQLDWQVRETGNQPIGMCE